VLRKQSDDFGELHQKQRDFVTWAGVALDEFSDSTVGKAWPVLCIHKLRALATRRPHSGPAAENGKPAKLKVFALVSLERRRSIAEVAGVTALGNLSTDGARHNFPFGGKADGGWHAVTLEPPSMTISIENLHAEYTPRMPQLTSALNSSISYSGLRLTASESPSYWSRPVPQARTTYASSQDIPSPLQTFDLAQNRINILNHGWEPVACGLGNHDRIVSRRRDRKVQRIFKFAPGIGQFREHFASTFVTQHQSSILGKGSRYIVARR
jgi:hypothetical protein